MFSEMTLFSIFSFLALLSAIMVIRAKNPVYSVLFLILVFCNTSGLLILIDLDFFAMVFLVVYVGAIAVLFLFVVMMLNIKLSEINENVLRYLPIGGVIGCIFLFEIFLVLDKDFIPLVAFDTTSALPLSETISFHFRFLLATLIPLLFSLFTLPFSSSEIVSQWFAKYQSFSDQLQNIDQVSDKYALTHIDYTIWPSKIENITTIEALGQVVYTYYVYFFIVASLILLVSMIGAIVLTMHKGIFVKRQEVFEQNTRDFSKTVKKVRHI